MRKFLLSLCAMSLTMLGASAQLTLTEKGNAHFGTPLQEEWSLMSTQAQTLAFPPVTPNNANDENAVAAFFGKYGTDKGGGYITFGKNNRTNKYVGIGELGKTETSKLWLFGSGGIYLTNGSTDTIAYFDKKRARQFVFNYDVKAKGVLLYSDSRLKKNVASIDGLSESLSEITPVSYTLVEPAEKASDGKSAVKAKETDRVRYGFVAQEIQEIFPDLVAVDEEGYLAVDYIGFIPILVDAVRNLQGKVESQEQLIEDLLNGNATPQRMAQAGINDLEGTVVARLYQNVPNPFNSTTTIKCDLPQSVASAEIYVFDLQGKFLMKESVADRGNASVTISAESLPAGLYIYSLIADGREIDSKRMILTD